MDEIKKLTNPKNYQKFDKKIIDKQFLLGKFYDATISSLVSPACKDKHTNTKKFPKSKLRKLLQKQLNIQSQLINKGKEELQQKQQDDQIGEKEDKKNSDLKIEQQYEFYLPLHRLWCRYILDLISKQKNQQSRELRILKSDFHGALITIASSKNQSLVGLQGIVIKQTLRTFQIIAKSPFSQTKSTKTVLKHICIFLIKIGNDLNFVLNGNSLVYRPSDRIKHKFKFKKAQKLNMQFLEAIGQQKAKIVEDGKAQIGVI